MNEREMRQRQRRVRLRDLETLMAVVNAGGMRKAAEELHLSQPAVSKTMRDLEDALGVRLLERGPRGAQPTLHGEALVRRSRAVFDELQIALQELDWLSDPESGEVLVGGGDTQQVGILAGVTRNLLERYPRMRITLVSAQAHELVGLLLPQRMVDLAIIRPLVEPLSAEIESEPLYHEQLQVLAGPDHPLARRRKLRLEEVADECWILSLNERMANSPVMKAFEAAGLPPPAKEVESGALSLRQALLLSGRFITCAPHTVVPFLRQHLGLRVLPVELPRWDRPTLALTLRGRMLGPGPRLFLETLREMARPFRLSH